MKRGNKIRMDEAIKFSELRIVIDSLFEHVIHQLKNALDRYYNDQKPEALFFTIIAFEELMKLSVYIDQYNARKGISFELYDKLLTHKYKLNTIGRKIKLFMGKISEKDYNKLLDECKVSLSPDGTDVEYNGIEETRKIWDEAFCGLDFLKQLILYFDWFEGNEITINRYMKNKLTKNHVEHLTLFLLEFVFTQFSDAKIRRMFPDNVFYQIPNESNIMTQSNSWKALEKFVKRQSNELAYSINISIALLIEFNMLKKNIQKKRKNARAVNTTHEKSI